MLIAVKTVFFLTCSLIAGNAVDLEVDWTLIPGKAGRDVVSGVLLKMAHLHSDSMRILRRLAFVETNDGLKKYGQLGNIWNIDEAMLDRTKNDSLVNFHSLIESSFGIKWTSTTYDDMKIPMLSGLAAHLNVEAISQAKPPDVASQAEYWATHYNAATADQFVFKVHQMKCHDPERNRHLDIVFVLDGFSGVSDKQFEQARRFIYNFTSEFNLDVTRFGLVLSSSVRTVTFPVNGSRTREHLNSLITNMQPIHGGPSTGGAMLEGLKLLTEARKRYATQIMLVVVDDISIDGLVATASEQLVKSNILTYAIGARFYYFSNPPIAYYYPLGQLTGETFQEYGHNSTLTVLPELLIIANNDREHVFLFQSFHLMLDSVSEFALALCQQPIVLPDKGNVTDTLTRDEKRYYKIKVPAKGIIVTIKPIYGDVKAYYSRKWKRPSRALNSGNFTGSKIFSGDTQYSYKITVTVEGVHEQNDYQLTIEEVGEEPLPTTTEAPSSVAETVVESIYEQNEYQLATEEVSEEPLPTTTAAPNDTPPWTPSPALVSWLQNYISTFKFAEKSDMDKAAIDISVRANPFRRLAFSLGIQN
ncbi:hypothetical protein HDE_11148 [Halotydeus destructor]|nr:hypothetical protein HDE_11148 [Halotydeus destructor]